tara:strand:- start:197 stop:2812 length:2616 start_codon:yes stop_codon:yes gene_type:complete
VFPLVANAAVPTELHYQGYLENAVGEPINCGDLQACPEISFTVTMRLYADIESEEALWTETHENVLVNEGIFHIEFASINTIEADLWDQASVLGVTVNELPEHRSPISPTGFALHSGRADQTPSATDALALNDVPMQDYVIDTELADLCVTETNLEEALTVVDFFDLLELSSFMLSSDYSAGAHLDEAEILSWLDLHTFVPGEHFSGNYEDLAGKPALSIVSGTSSMADLLDLPEGLLDGDDDSFAALLCEDGNLLKASDEGWVCAADNNVDETLSEETVDAYTENEGYAYSIDLAPISTSGLLVELTGLPDGLVDGDDNTLVQLGCSDGHIPVWHGAAWSCHEDINVDLQRSEEEVDTIVSDNGYAFVADLAPIVHSGDFATLANIPSGLNDSDDNAIETLDCLVGQMARWNGTAWACSDDIDVDEQLDESTVDSYAENNGYAINDTLSSASFTGIFTELINRPAGLEDGDQDTLVDIGCTTGQIAKYGFGGWECGDDEDALSPGTQLPRQNIRTILDTVGTVGRFTSISIGSDLLPVMSYLDLTNAALRIAKCTVPDCSQGTVFQSIDAGNVGASNTSLAIGPDGFPGVAYYGSGGGLRYLKCSTHDCSEAAVAVVDGSGNVGKNASLAFGTDGLPVISYLDVTDGDLRTAHCADTSCTAGTTVSILDSAGVTGWYTSIAIGADGLPIIAYHGFVDNDLKVAKCLSKDCSTGATITSVDAVGFTGANTSISITNGGEPLIAYRTIATRDIKVARCTLPDCSSGTAIVTVVDDVDSSSETSITFDAQGYPVISFYDSTNKALRLIHCSDRGCANAVNVATVDSELNAGWYASVTLGADGNPIIAYQHRDSEDLVVMHCANAFCISNWSRR